MLILSKISRSFFSFVSVTPTTDIGKYNSDSILTRLSKLACKLLILQFKKESENDKDDDNASWDCELPRRFGLMTVCGGEYLHTYVEKLANERHSQMLFNNQINCYKIHLQAWYLCAKTTGHVTLAPALSSHKKVGVYMCCNKLMKLRMPRK